MTNKTKTIIGVVAVAGIGYYLYMQMKKKQGSNKNFANYVDEDFYNLTRGTRSGCVGGNCTPTTNICGESCDGGVCYVPIYDAQGQVTYSRRSCTGTSGNTIQNLR
jgi:hypothetical protein